MFAAAADVVAVSSVHDQRDAVEEPERPGGATGRSNRCRRRRRASHPWYVPDRDAARSRTGDAERRARTTRTSGCAPACMRDDELADDRARDELVEVAEDEALRQLASAVVRPPHEAQDEARRRAPASDPIRVISSATSGTSR